VAIGGAQTSRNRRLTAGPSRPRVSERVSRACPETSDPAPDFATADLMRVPIEWAEQQFGELGRCDAHDLAVSLLASYEGSALLTNTFRDPDILAREARRLNRWIDTL
jgi:hypothetical protein